VVPRQEVPAARTISCQGQMRFLCHAGSAWLRLSAQAGLATAKALGLWLNAKWCAGRQDCLGGRHVMLAEQVSVPESDTKRQSWYRHRRGD